MTIFIPVLFICLADVCNFMQGQTLHKTEAKCRVAIDVQKMHLSEMAKDTGKPTILEGTCISVEIPRSNT
jgi:hypothetical protein